MVKIENGLYEINDAMPCTPRDLIVPKYMLPATLDRAEREEAAARILQFSQEMDRWVGVSLPKIFEQIKGDYATSQSRDEIQRHNRAEVQRYIRAVRWDMLWSVVTLGIYCFFRTTPTKNLKKDIELPFTAALYVGPAFVMEGIRELVERGMLRVEQDDNTDVVFPTPSLITRILEVQEHREATA
jgi:hypothetical protein